MFLLKGTTQWCWWGSNPRPFGLESSTLPLSHCTPPDQIWFWPIVLGLIVTKWFDILMVLLKDFFWIKYANTNKPAKLPSIQNSLTLLHVSLPVVEPTIPVFWSTASRNWPMTRGTLCILLTSSWACRYSFLRFFCSSLMYSSCTSRNSSCRCNFYRKTNNDTDMWFPTMWHFDKCRLRRASAASF